MKAQFLKMAGVNSEDEFYNMFPTEESFFQAYPEARNYANGGQPYPWSYPEYGMQGRGAGAQIPVETYYAYGGSSNGPLGYFDDGGSAWNYGQFPAFAKKGNQVQGGGIDAATGSMKDNFLAAIQKNVNKAMLDQETEQALEMNQERMPQLIAQYGAEAGSMFMPNMYNQNMFESRSNDLNNQSMYTNRNVLGMAKFLTNNAINNKMKSISDQQKAQDEYYSNLEKQSGFKDAQTVPGFNPIPGNMAKYGGSLKKYQDGSQTGDPFLAEIQKIQAELAAEKVKAKTDAEQAKLNELKKSLNYAITNYGAGTAPAGFDPKSNRRGLALGVTYNPATTSSKEDDIKNIQNAYKAYNDYAISIGATSTAAKPGAKPAATPQCGAGQQWSSIYKICYTPITSNDQYYRGIGNSNKSAEQMAAEKEWTINPNHLSYQEWLQTQPKTQQTSAPVAPAPVAPTKAAAPKAPAKPATEIKYTKESVRTIYNY